MAGPYRRMIDGEGPAILVRERRMGVLTQRDLRREQERGNRFQTSIPTQIISVPLIPWFQVDIPASATTTMRIEIPNTGPAFGTTGGGTNIKMARAGRIIGGELKCSASVTAGNMVLAVRIAGVDYQLSDVIANATNPTGIMTVMAWANGIPFALGDTVQPTVITDAGFLPAGSVDVKAMLIAAFEAI